MNTIRTLSYEVSIVIPIYNGSRLLKKHMTPFLAWLKGRPYRTQVILVDDGSSDGDITAAYAREQGLLFVGLNANKGKGAALREGFAHARANIQLFTDADIPFHYKNIDSFISLLNKNPDNLLIGDRTDPRSVYFEKTGLLRNTGSKLISLLVRTLFMKNVRDTQCGLKGMTRQNARRLFGASRIDRFAIDIELICLASLFEIPVCKVPVQLRANDTSTVRPVRDGLSLLYDMCRIRKIHGLRYRRSAAMTTLTALSRKTNKKGRPVSVGTPLDV